MAPAYYTYKCGRLTVIGFDGKRALGDNHCTEVTCELLDLLGRHACEVLVVDLMDVPVASSWVLGILAAIQCRGIRVELYHPSRAMDEVLAVSHLDRLLHIRHRTEPTATQPAATQVVAPLAVPPNDTVEL